VQLTTQKYLERVNASIDNGIRGGIFRTAMLNAISAALGSGRLQPSPHVAAVIDEMVHHTGGMEDQVGKAVTEYWAYRFAGGPQPVWHQQLTNNQDAEQETVRQRLEREGLGG
jgi:hypothetical protein